MANYPVIKPEKGQVVVIPSSTKATLIRAWHGDLLISSDPVFSAENAMPLLRGETHRMPAGQTWRCARQLGAAELRRMDID